MRSSPGTVVVALGAVAVIVVQQFVGFVRMHGEPVPLLPVGLWRLWIPAVLCGLLALAAGAAIRFRGNGILRVAGLVLALAPAALLAFQGRLIDPLFLWEAAGVDLPVAVWPVVDVVLGAVLTAALLMALLVMRRSLTRPS